jgi:hypothetical protein
VAGWGLLMKTIRGEADTNDGFTDRVLLGMGTTLAEAVVAVQMAVVQFNALAVARGIPACPNPLKE